MEGPTRIPPRFVPTLTAVVDLDAQAAPAPVAAPAPAPLVAAPVEAVPPAQAPAAAQAPDFKALTPDHEAEAFRLEEELLHRVLQRVDLSLEERLTEVVSATVQQQLDAMVPRLRAQVETALRQLVVEAMAQELLENPGSGPGSGAPRLG